VGNFVPKTPFDLTSFLNKPGKPKTPRYLSRRDAQAKTGDEAAPAAEAPNAGSAAASLTTGKRTVR
jgi:hypothetical protein